MLNGDEISWLTSETDSQFAECLCQQDLDAAAPSPIGYFGFSIQDVSVGIWDILAGRHVVHLYVQSIIRTIKLSHKTLCPFCGTEFKLLEAEGS